MKTLSPELQRFLCENVETLEELELLVLFHRDPGQHWSAESAEHALRLPESVLEAALRALKRRGLIEQAASEMGGYALVTTDARRQAQVSALVRAYEADRYGLMMKISEAAMDRVRQSMTRAFADAFIIGRRRGDG